MSSRDHLALTAAQRGLVTTRQLADLGWSFEERRWAVRCGDLLQHRRGVLELPGLPPDPWRRLHAALLAVPDGVASGFAACGLHELPGVEPGAVEVVVQRTTLPRLAGVRASVDVSLDRAVVRTIGGLPCLSPPEAVVSVVGRVRERTWRRMVDAVERAEGAAGMIALAAAVERRGPKHRPSLGALSALLDLRVPGAAGDCDRTAEVLTWLRDAGLPAPLQQHRVRWLGVPNVCDLVWLPQLLNVEVDDDWSHGTVAGSRRDKARDTRARRCGWTVERVTPETTRHELVGAVAARLGRRATG